MLRPSLQQVKLGLEPGPLQGPRAQLRAGPCTRQEGPGRMGWEDSAGPGPGCVMHLLWALALLRRARGEV